VIKSETHEILVDSLLESRDATFFENRFPMKDAYSLPSSSNEFIPEPTPSIEPIINPHGNKEDDSGVAPRSKRQRVVTTKLTATGGSRCLGVSRGSSSGD
jgi:hypothetical protein